MATREKAENDKVYLTIVDGSLRETVNENTPGAVRRDWEAGGKKGTKWEIIDRAVKGTIVDLLIYEGEHEGKKFTTLNVVLDKDTESDKHPVVTTTIEGRYAQDILKKLPNVDFSEEVRIRPYSYVPNGKDKPTKGVEITQRDAVTGQFTKKVESFFDGYDETAKKFFGKNGFPMPEGNVAEFDSDDWKSYFIRVKKFLVSYTREQIMPRFANIPQAMPKTKEEQDALDHAYDNFGEPGVAKHPDEQ